LSSELDTNNFALLLQIYSFEKGLFSQDNFIEFIESKRSLIPIFRTIMEYELPHGASGIPSDFTSIIKSFYEDKRTPEMCDELFFLLVEEEFDEFPLYVKHFHTKKKKALSDSDYSMFLMNIIMREIDYKHQEEKVLKIYIPFLSELVPDVFKKLKGDFTMTRIETIIAE